VSATVRDIARLAGVSTATVSRALRDFPSVDPLIRERVLQAAGRLDYVGSPAAAALSTGRTNTIAIITPYIARWSFTRMLAGVDRALRTTPMDLLVYCLGDPSDPHPAPPHRRLRNRVDAFLVLSVAADSPDLEEIVRIDAPVALLGSSRPDVTSVSIDDRAAARTAVEHLIERGHERIGLIFGRERTNPLALEHQRYLGYLDALSGAGLTPDTSSEEPGLFTVAGGAAAMETLLANEQRLTAVFAMSDEMAFGALRTLAAHHLRPGQDVALIGFDGHDMDDVLDLSTISQPLEELGARAVKGLLVDLARGRRSVTHEVLPTQLVVRGSSSPELLRVD